MHKHTNKVLLGVILLDYTPSTNWTAYRLTKHAHPLKLTTHFNSLIRWVIHILKPIFGGVFQIIKLTLEGFQILKPILGRISYFETRFWGGMTDFRGLFSNSKPILRSVSDFKWGSDFKTYC